MCFRNSIRKADIKRLLSVVVGLSAGEPNLKPPQCFALDQRVIRPTPRRVSRNPTRGIDGTRPYRPRRAYSLSTAAGHGIGITCLTPGFNRRRKGHILSLF